MSAKRQKIKLAILSAGLGNIHRGFEVAASRLFAGLQGDPVLEARLLCGGLYQTGIQCWNVPRNGVIARVLRRLHVIHDGCRLEQMSFAVGAFGRLIFWRPDVVWIQEYEVGCMLKLFRKIFRLRFKILFCDGAPCGPTATNQFDYVQHLHPISYNEAIQYGIRGHRMFVMPYWIVNLSEPAPDAVRVLKERLKIRTDDFIVVSVAAWNCRHKRIDYLIKEIAAIRSDKVLLVLCGQAEADTPFLKDLGARMLSNQIRWVTLPAEVIPTLLKLADAFVLASLSEGLPNALVESAVMGVPTIAHDNPASRNILEDKGVILDLSQPSTLKMELEKMLAKPWSNEDRSRLRDSARDRFLAEALLPGFRNRICAIAAGQPLARE